MIPHLIKKFLPQTSAIPFDLSLGVEGFKKKVGELNEQQASDTALTKNEFNIVVSLANGFAQFREDNFNVSKKMLKWAPEHRFPVLDLYRRKCVSPTSQSSSVYKEILNIFVDHMEKGQMAYTTNAMLSARGVANMLSNSTLAKLVMEKQNDIVEKINTLSGAYILTRFRFTPQSSFSIVLLRYPDYLSL